MKTMRQNPGTVSILVLVVITSAAWRDYRVEYEASVDGIFVLQRLEMAQLASQDPVNAPTVLDQWAREVESADSPLRLISTALEAADIPVPEVVSLGEDLSAVELLDSVALGAHTVLEAEALGALGENERALLPFMVRYLMTTGGTYHSSSLEAPSYNWGLEAGLAPTKLACQELVSLTGYDYSINSARLVSATDDLPEYCEVEGQILPEVAFKLRLPTRWNQRFLMLGNGGFAGGISGNLNLVREFLAVAGTNTGHISPPQLEQAASFAQDRQKLIDFGYRAVHVTSLTAKEIIGLYYDLPLEYSYFSGSSTGGRQGLMSAQRFPDDFDGILVGAPVVDHVGMVISHAWIAKALRNAPKDLRLLAERVYEKCDSVDGLMDGLIDDPRRCAFDPSDDLPACGARADRSECYTESEIRALAAVYEDVVVDGERLFPAFPVGSEAFVDFSGVGVTTGPGWYLWRVGVEKPLFEAFTETFLRYMAFERADPDFDMFTFDFQEDPARMEWVRPILDATDPDLRRFRDRGGKMLMYFGWADPAANPLMGIEYYERVLEKMGPSVPEFFRLFMVPGMFHGDVGVGVDRVSWIPELMDWVEEGEAPDRIVGTRSGQTPRVGDDPIGRTRPLCPYPQIARYKGEGSIDDAANFECTDPTSPVGSTGHN